MFGTASQTCIHGSWKRIIFDKFEFLHPTSRGAVCRQTEERSKADQLESGRRLGERITDTAFWRNELASELDEIIKESDLLQDSKRAVEKALADIEAPLHIAQENLYQREQREGTV